MSVLCILALSALVTAILSLANRCDGRVPIFILAVCEALRCLPLGR